MNQEDDYGSESFRTMRQTRECKHIITAKYPEDGKQFTRASAVVSPCPHCAEDAKVLEERLERVVFAVGDLCFAVRAHDQGAQDIARDAIREALRDLVREVQRSR